MYRNREGNKILLDIMDRGGGTGLRDKIWSVVVGGESSRFYHERWGVQMGIRSGPVGGWGSFTEAEKGASSGVNGYNKKGKKK